MHTRSLVLAAAAVAALALPAAAADPTYVYRVRTAPPAPVVAEAPRPPVPTLVLAPAMTYWTSRPLAVILAELADGPYQTIGGESFEGARRATIDWRPTDSAATVAVPAAGTRPPPTMLKCHGQGPFVPIFFQSRMLGPLAWKLIDAPR